VFGNGTTGTAADTGRGGPDVRTAGTTDLDLA